jgi:pilus assembly protein Flp/PilA
MRLIVRFLKDEKAATAIEYGLIATGIAVAVIPVITGLGTRLKTTFSSIASALK